MGNELTTTVTDLAHATNEQFALVQRKSQLLAASTIVPSTFQGNVANCCVALNMAERIGADVLSVMQSLYIVHGKPAWSSTFLIACINTCGRFDAIEYEFSGKRGTDSWGCCAVVRERATDKELRGTKIDIALAKAEGWYGKRDSKWQTMPEQMLRYRAAAFWVRAYAPELSLGMHTADELEDSAKPVGFARAATVTTTAVTEAPPEEPEKAPEKPKRKRRAKTPAKKAEPVTADPEPSGGETFGAQVLSSLQKAKTKDEVTGVFESFSALCNDEDELMGLEFACNQRIEELKPAPEFDANGLPT